MLELVRLAELGARRPHQLSGGQKQRVALARALINQPKVLLLDEPLGALDLKLREEMQAELKGLQQRLGITFVFVTHDQGEALSMADRVAVFSQGRIEQLDTPRELYNRPRTAFVASFVGSANVVDADAARELTGHGAAAFAIRPELIEIVADGAVAGGRQRPLRGRSCSTCCITARAAAAACGSTTARRWRWRSPKPRAHVARYSWPARACGSRGGRKHAVPLQG